MNTTVSVASVASAVAIPAHARAGDHPERTAAEQLARVEQMIHLLRTCHIRDGWKLDEAAAERVLRFFRTSVQFPTTHEEQPGYDDDWMFVIRFISDHGQSFDWLLAGDVGGMICRAASRSRAAAKLIVDPIVAAIEEHRTAFFAHLELITNTEKDDDDLICEGPEYEVSYERTEDAAVALANVQPTSVEGALALLAYVQEFNTGAIKCTRRQSCYSEHNLWPEYLTDDDVKSPRGRVLKLPFPYWIMENVRVALGAINEAA